MDNKKCRGKNNRMKSCDFMENSGWGIINLSFSCSYSFEVMEWYMLYYGYFI